MAGVVGHAVHVVGGTGTTENRPTAQAVHAIVLAVLVQEPLLDVPAGHTVHGVHVVAPVVFVKLLPATQDVQTRLAVGVHVEAT